MPIVGLACQDFTFALLAKAYDCLLSGAMILGVDRRHVGGGD